MSLALLVALMVAQSGFVPQSRPKSAMSRICVRRIARGDVEAEVALGNLYESGQSVLPLDPAQAAEWYRRAADKGHAGAQMNLAMMYLDGQGVPRDVPQAVAWYEKAADGGDAIAMFQPWFHLRDRRRSRVARRCQSRDRGIGKAAEHGLGTAQYRLGMLYRDGRGDSPRSHASHRLASQGGRSRRSRCPDRARDPAQSRPRRLQPTSSRRTRGSTWRPRAGKTKASA